MNESNNVVEFKPRDKKPENLQGKITIECGDRKAVFTIDSATKKVSAVFTPAKELLSVESKADIFVTNFSNLIIDYMRGL